MDLEYWELLTGEAIEEEEEEVAYREWEVITWGLADLGLTEEELSPLIGLQRKAFPPERTLGELITGTPDEAAKELAQVLREIRN